jgi:hypothetical protein
MRVHGGIREKAVDRTAAAGSMRKLPGDTALAQCRGRFQSAAPVSIDPRPAERYHPHPHFTGSIRKQESRAMQRPNGVSSTLAGMIAAASFAAILCSLAPSCAAMKASQQPNKRDMQVLSQGVPRTHVIAELGAPVWSEARNGETVDVFAFKQGYSKTTKAARALVHGAADVATFGLWEVVGIPAETLVDGTDVQVEVHYGPQQTIDRVVVIKGEKAVHPPKLFARKPKDAAAKSAAPPF